MSNEPRQPRMLAATSRWPLAVLGLLWGCSAVLSGCDDDAPLGPPDPPDGTITIEVPGFPPMPVPADNALTANGIALGRRLFYDPILSGDRTQSCASCHAQAFAFSDNGLRFSVGIDGLEGTRNAPPIINLAWAGEMFWEGRAADLEAQALEPVPNPIEMHLDWETAEERLRDDDVYPDLFQDVFGDEPITRDLAVKAIAQFERTLISVGSKFDRFWAGEETLAADEMRGFELFFDEAADCFHCHGRPFFTDHLFHNNGIDSLIVDAGRSVVTGNPNDHGKFRTPTLRNIELTAPYMHDGRFATLEEVIEHYDTGGHFTPTVDPVIRVGVGLGLTDEDKSDLIAFLKTLSDPAFLANPDFSDPFEE